MRLRYTGTIPVTFASPVGEVQPDGEFDVPDADAQTYLARTDLEAVDPAPEPEQEAAPAKPKPTRAAKTADGADADS